MVLQTDVPNSIEVLQSTTKLVVSIVGILAGRRPFIQIHIYDLLVIEHHLDATALAGQHTVIPLAGLVDRVLCRFLAIVDGSGRTLVVPVVPAEGIAHLYLDPRIDRVLQIGCVKEDAAVGALNNLELQIENEIAVLLFRPDVIEVVLAAVHITSYRKHAVFAYPRVVGSRDGVSEVFALKQLFEFRFSCRRWGSLFFETSYPDVAELYQA